MAKYKPIWESIIPAFFLAANKSLFYMNVQRLILDEILFTAVGERAKSGHSFRLEIYNGEVAKNSNSQVARDLVSSLFADHFLFDWIGNKHIIIRLNRKFELLIEVQH